jgi:serine/threonine protein kinase
MRYLHSRPSPIIHKDLRSPNVCIVSLDPTAFVTAKILDFGLAEILCGTSRDRLCTWQWVAPEVLTSHEADVDKMRYDQKCDVYSFGIVLNELASRLCPFLDDYWDLHCTPDGLQWRFVCVCASDFSFSFSFFIFSPITIFCCFHSCLSTDGDFF